MSDSDGLLRVMMKQRPATDEQAEVRALLANLKEQLPDLEALLRR